MSREIKFRVWDVKNKEYVRAMDEPFIQICDDDDVIDADENGDGGYRYATETFNRNYYLLEQYTGLKDKNGKEIYEGDKWRSPVVTETYYLIKWDNRGATFKKVLVLGDEEYNSSSTTQYDLLGVEEGEIIGNIHENPELLKESSDE